MRPFVFMCVLVVAVSTAHSQYIQIVPKLVGSGATAGAHQGASVAISSDGNTAVVGGTGDNGNVGAVWVFRRVGGAWVQQGSKLVGAGGVGTTFQGWSVAVSSDGTTMIEGGPYDNGIVGAAWVFQRIGAEWFQQQKLIGTGGSGISGQGYGVAISSDGNTAVIGGPSDSSYFGAAWVFTRSNGIWSQQGPKLVGTGSAGVPQQGISVALSSDGNTAVIGGNTDHGSTGAAWVFTRSAGSWTQQGSKLVGTGAAGNAAQGYSISLSSDGNTMISGGYFDSSQAGAAWVFTRSSGVWSQQGNKLVGAGAAGFARQGYSVGLSSNGDKAIIGGDGDDNSLGAAWIFTRTGGVWSQQGGKLSSSGALGVAAQGSSVGLSGDGNTAVIGGFADNNGEGAAWIFMNARPHIVSVSDVPFDQGGTVAVAWDRSVGDDAQFPVVTQYLLWRGMVLPPTSSHPVVLSRADYLARLIRKEELSNTYVVSPSAGPDSPLGVSIFWEYMKSLPSHGFA